MVAGIDANFLNLTGRSKGIQGVTPYSTPANAQIGGGSEEAAVTSGRALDRAPRGVGFSYEEYTNVGAGRAGQSKWSCYM